MPVIYLKPITAALLAIAMFRHSAVPRLNCWTDFHIGSNDVFRHTTTILFGVRRMGHILWGNMLPKVSKSRCK